MAWYVRHMVLEPTTPVPSERRERTMRGAASAAVNALGNDTFHKGVNWTTLIGTVTLAVLGYLADARNGEKQEKIAGGAATEIVLLTAAAEDAKARLDAQAEQITNLRIALGKLQAVNEALAAAGAAPVRARAREAASGFQELLDDAPPAPAPKAAAGVGPPPDLAERLKRKLLSTE
ncbi:MAG TPA: hypothetical protein VLI71_09860 [Gammaproteobacteria bacterium]|nr:hypothetical protein [Gammaproteobacteria bacterium]